jgi:hypothetical protein
MSAKASNSNNGNTTAERPRCSLLAARRDKAGKAANRKGCKTGVIFED